MLEGVGFFFFLFFSANDVILDWDKTTRYTDDPHYEFTNKTTSPDNIVNAKSNYATIRASLGIREPNAGRSTVDTFRSVHDWRYAAVDGVYECG